MNEELKACPFCGGKAIANIKEPERVNCSTEGCYQSEAWREYGMRPQTWNTRPLEDAQAARIAELEVKVKALHYGIAIAQIEEPDWHFEEE